MGNAYTCVANGSWSSNSTWGTAAAGNYPGSQNEGDSATIGGIYAVTLDVSPPHNLSGLTLSSSTSASLLVTSSRTLSFQNGASVNDTASGSNAIQVAGASTVFSMSSTVGNWSYSKSGSANTSFSITSGSASISFGNCNVVTVSGNNANFVSANVGSSISFSGNAVSATSSATNSTFIYCSGATSITFGGSLTISGINSTGFNVGGTSSLVLYGNLTASTSNTTGLYYASSAMTSTITGNVLTVGGSASGNNTAATGISLLSGQVTLSGNLSSNVAGNPTTLPIGLNLGGGTFVWSGTPSCGLNADAIICMNASGASNFNMAGTTLNVGTNGKLAFLQGKSLSTTPTFTFTGASIKYGGVGAGATCPGVNLPIAAASGGGRIPQLMIGGAL